MVRYKYENGMSFLPEFGGGACFPQIYCAPLNKEVEKDKELDVRFTDDVIFAPEKKGLFQIVALLNSSDEVNEAKVCLRDVDALSESEVLSDEATFLIHDPTAVPSPKLSAGTFRVATADEFAQIEALCGNRPAPRYYDMYRLKKEVRSKKFVILRPDRFVYAICDTREELNEATRKIPGVFRGEA
jgi:hypothetical protein